MQKKHNIYRCYRFISNHMCTVHGAKSTTSDWIVSNYCARFFFNLWSACCLAESLHLKVVESVQIALQGAGSACELQELLSLQSRTGKHSKSRGHNEDVEVACDEEYPDFWTRTILYFKLRCANKRKWPSWFSVVAVFPWFSAAEMVAEIDFSFWLVNLVMTWLTPFGLVNLLMTWLTRFALVNLVMSSFNTARCSTLDRRSVRQQSIWMLENWE